MKLRLTYLALLASLVSCGGRVTDMADDMARKEACEVASAASRDLSLKPGQTKTLRDALYDLNARTGAIAQEDPSKASEMSSRAYKSFQDRINSEFSKDKAAEIIAWFYNYSNAKQ